VLLLLFVVPLLMALVSPRRSENCRDPEALRATSQIRGSEPLGERLGARSDNVVQWSQGVIHTEAGSSPLHFQIVRSHDWRTHALNVLKLVDAKFEGESQQLIDAGTNGRVPVHVVVDNTQASSRLIAYSFMDGAENVSQPFLHELQEAFRHFLSGSTPITILIASGSSSRHSIDQVRTRAISWIVDAAHYVKTSCGPSA